MTISQGDKCWVQVHGKKHYGICTGLGFDGQLWFVHNTRVGGVLHTTWKGFAGNRPVYIEQRAQPGQASVVAARALQLVGSQYNLLAFNCEHAANWAANGKAESKQVQQSFVATGIVSAILLAIANQNGTTVDRSGYRRDGNGRFASRRWW
ncbi:MAG: lecithin retinol acyltransferase family protein [Myxococcales bacterium]|nr:lecithin retinol acyltransferase family protein [Myxococcales bacterium]